jgi:hypothetical protein
MRATPPLYVLVWWSGQERKHTVTIYDRIDDACGAYDESEGGDDVVGAAKLLEVVASGVGRTHWVPFDIAAAHRWWTEDKIDDARERDRTRAMVRREQMP